MTNKEALVATLQTSVPDSSLDLALINAGVVGRDFYLAKDQAAIEKCAANVLSGLLSTPNVTEGGYSVSYDRKAVEARLLFLAKKNGMSDIVSELSPTVNSRSVW